MSWLLRRWYSDQPPPCWLLPLERFFTAAAQRRKRKLLASQWHAPVPLIVVGNISVGGTGKTPLVLYLCEQLALAGWKPGIISRGYKSEATTFPFQIEPSTPVSLAGDEPALLAQRSGCPVVIAPDRVAAAQYLLQHNDCDLIISDDGMQHYALGRDLEIAVLDGKRGLGNLHCLPAGPLREPVERLSQVDFVVVNGRPERLGPALTEHADQMALKPLRFCSLDGSQQKTLDAFSGQIVHALAGIGHPERFFQLLRDELQLQPECHAFPDHHSFAPQELQFDPEGVVLMTEKDAVKLRGSELKNSWYLEVSAQLPDNFIPRLLEQLDRVKNKGESHHG